MYYYVTHLFLVLFTHFTLFVCFVRHENDRKYANLVDQKLIPVSESLQDTLDRTMPLWANEIKPDLQAGRNVLIVAHANSLRGIVKVN